MPGSSDPSSSGSGATSPSHKNSHGGSEEESTSSTDKDLDAPLRKKSKKKPGSVLQMLVAHARSQLDQSAKVGLDPAEEDKLNTKVKIGSYFAIVVRPQVNHAMAQTRELHHLAQCVDLLRQGDLALLGDVLAGRFISLHQAVIDGTWTTARHMELFPLEEGTAAGPEVVMRAKRHAKLAARLSPGDNWTWSNQGKGRGKSRGNWGDGPSDGKGKGKKGSKGKSKNKTWSNFEKEGDAKTKEKVPEKNKEEQSLREFFEVDDFPLELVNQPLGALDRVALRCAASVALGHGRSVKVCSVETAERFLAGMVLPQFSGHPPRQDSHPDNLHQLRLLLSEELVIQTVSTAFKPHSKQLPFVAAPEDVEVVQASDLVVVSL
eukprot:Skav206958  [mRNA]  locus=scaffold6419:118970:130867:- [translate_table: standard]